jgi:hypothetical protein
MNVTCPSCGAEMGLDVLLAHDDSRQALARLVALSVPLGRVVLQYLRLFKPAQRAMSHGRTVKLIEELLPDLERGAVTHKGRDWPAPLPLWQAAIERMLAQRDQLTLPMKSHGYLVEIVVGLADKAEAQQEREHEEERRARRGGGGEGRDRGQARACAATNRRGHRCRVTHRPPPAAPFPTARRATRCRPAWTCCCA